VCLCVDATVTKTKVQFLASRHTEFQALAIPPGDPVTILRGLKGLAPAVGRLTLPVTNIIALATLAEMAENQMENRIRNGLKKKTKREKKDNQQVVKVSDAIDCVENALRDPKLLLKTGKEIINAVTGADVRTIINIATDVIAQCIREHALRQDTPRKIVEKRFYHRPARGHGKGRRSF